MLLRGRAWCDYVLIAHGLPLYVKRVVPHEDSCAKLLAAIAAAERKIEEVVQRCRALFNGEPVDTTLVLEAQ